MTYKVSYLKGIYSTIGLKGDPPVLKRGGAPVEMTEDEYKWFTGHVARLGAFVVPGHEPGYGDLLFEDCFEVVELTPKVKRSPSVTSAVKTKK